MLKIKDKDGKTKMVLRDEDEEPISIDELVLQEALHNKKKAQSQEKEDAN